MSTQLVVSAAINIAVALAINYLFPPPDTVQEGPRLNDLDLSSSSYGRPTNVLFGTDRVPGNIIWGEPIEEVRNEERSGGKGGKGGSVTSITYTYFATFSIAFSINGADDILRLWADGKLIMDKRGTSDIQKAGLTFTIFPGGATQQVDPLEAADKGTANTPAYRHLTRIVFDRMPLADFGNRIPSITAEVTFNGTKTFPFVGLTEVPALTLGVLSKMAVDNRTNSFFGLSEQLGVDTYRADRTSGLVQSIAENVAPLLTSGYGWDIILGSSGGDTSVPVRRINAITGQQVGISTFTVANGVGGYFMVHKVGNDLVGDVLFGVKGGNSIVSNVYYLFVAKPSGEIIGDESGGPEAGFELLETIIPAGADPISNEVNISIPDDERGFDSQNIYVVSLNGAQTRVAKISFTFAVAEFQSSFNQLFDVVAVAASIIEQETGVEREPEVAITHSIETLSDFTFPSGSATPTGWAVDASTGRLLISNGSSTVLYDPETKAVVATSTVIGFDGWNNYVSGGLFAYAKGTSTTGEIVQVNVADLTVIRRDSLSVIGWAGNDGVDDDSSVWDDSGQAVIFSRLSGFTGDADERVVRVFINRGTGTGVTLQSVVTALLSSYEGITMADLVPADFDVTALAGLTVEGYNIDRQSTVRAALEPLRQAYLFDIVQSDWILKSVLRGGASVLTIPADQVGEAKFNEEGPNESVQETRTQEVELPMRLNIRYTDRTLDYDKSVEYAKRMLKPAPAMFSHNEKTLDIPIVFGGGTIPKRTAHKWLFSLWNERMQYHTILPWTFLKLDPTDIFEMVVFDETIRLRLAEQDIGLGLSTEIMAVKESASTFDSLVDASAVSGLITQTVPSRDPTKLILLDAPLLLAVDLNQGESSAAYAAMGSYTSGWPGAVAHVSADGVTFERRGTSNAEMAWGVVTDVPSAIGADNDCGDFPNRFQEVAEGGTLTINVQRRTAAFTSSVELSVLNGNNMIAVVTVDGVEIIQFQDVSVPDADFPNRLLLSRLLRGRLGTEDIAIAGGPVKGDEVVLLRGDTQELAAIFTLNVLFANLGKNLTYKPATVGTELETAFSQRFIYTGRDLRPYRPAHIAISNIGDPDDPDQNAELVMNFEGVDAAQSGPGFDNIGTEGSQPTAVVGNAQIDTAQKPAAGDSTSSLLLDGTGDYLRWTDRAEWEFGSNPITITCHFRLNALGIFHTLASQYDATTTQRSWLLHVTTANILRFAVFKTGLTQDIPLNGTTALVTGQDYHAAVVRKLNGDWVLFLDGAIEAGPTTPANDPFNSTADLRIGALESGGAPTQFHNGHIDSFEIIVGFAKWEAAFTPPTGNVNVAASILNAVWERRTRLNGDWVDGTGLVPLNESEETYEATLATAIASDLSLLMNFGGLQDATDAIDHSTNAHALTYGAGAKVSTEQQQFGLASLALNGAGADPSSSFISVADNAAFEFGSGQFTVDCFVRFTSLVDLEQVIASKYLNTGDERSWILERNGNELRFIFSLDGTSTLTTISGAFTFALDTWYHVAVDRDSSDDIRLYVDGAVVGGPTAAAVTIFAGTALFHIGKLRSAGFDDFPMTGFVDDMVIVKGRALYAGAFTPRTAAFPTGRGFLTKTVGNAKTVDFTTAERALGQGEALRIDVRQISGTGLKSPPAQCLVPIGV